MAGSGALAFTAFHVAFASLGLVLQDGYACVPYWQSEYSKSLSNILSLYYW